MNKNNEVDDFLAGLEGEAPADPFNTDETDPFNTESDANATAKTGEEADVEGTTTTEKEPFHKDPKVQRYVQREIAKALEGIKPQGEVEKFIKETVGEDDDELTDVLTRMIGNDTPEKVAVLKDFKKALGNVEARGAQKAMSQFQAEQQRIVQEDAKAQAALTQGFEDIEDEYGVDITSSSPVAKKTRNDFIDFVKRIAPKNSQGIVTEFPDFSEAFQIFQDTKKADKPNNSRAKELANRGMARSSATTTQVKVKDNSWNAVDRIFSKFN